MAKQKLTRTVLDRFLEKVKAGTAETKVLHDTLEPGLTVRANKETLSYRYLYRNKEGVLKPLTLGKYPGVEPDVARKAVRKAKGEIVLGTDVQAEKQKRRALTK